MESSLEAHAADLLIWYITNFADEPMNDDLADIWNTVLEAQDGLSRYQKQVTLRKLFHWLDDVGDDYACTCLRFYVWQHSTDSSVREKLGNEIRKSWTATEYMKEQVMNG